MLNTWHIFGAGGGIGSAIARELGRQGCDVTLLDRKEVRDRLEQDAHDITTRYQVQADVKSFALGDDGYHSLLHGELKIHEQPCGIVWAVGIMEDQAVLDRDHELARTMHEINYTAPMIFFQTAVQLMLDARGGHIVAMGSPAGDRGRKSNYLYGADKAALHTLLEGLLHKTARTGIKITTVKPGPTRTGMTAGMDKLPLLAEPRDQARRIVQAVEKGKAVVYTPPIWEPIMCVIRHLPRVIYNRLNL